jgi:hypothetical protein
MKTLKIPYFYAEDTAVAKAALSSFMDSSPSQEIGHNSWPEFTHNCEAKFTMAHAGDILYVKYFVREDALQASTREINGDVYRDNCVELFIAFGEEEDYYNIEFNCLGTGKMAYGKGRQGRKNLPVELVMQIGVAIALRLTDNKTFHWELMLGIPVKTFCFHDFTDLQGLVARANFYKCGDDLPQPHFLSWNPVEAKTPDFHVPVSFGQLHFV